MDQLVKFEKNLEKQFRKIDEIALFNQKKVLDSFDSLL